MGGEYENILFCDNNKFCQEVLKKNFGKESLIYGDIREVNRERVIADTNRRGSQEQEPQTAGDKQCYRGIVAHPKSGKPRQSAQQEGWENIGRSYCNLLTGGFPCQPFSCAGKRRGTDDNRYLWPEMLRVIRDFKPTWIIAENVRGLLTIEGGVVFEQVCLDLERENYNVQAFIIPAVAVNAPHRRDRIWIIANRISNGYPQRHPQTGGAQCPGEQGRVREPAGEDCAIADASNIPGRAEQEKQPGGEARIAPGVDRRFIPRSWERPWLEVATGFCQLDDGVSHWMDRCIKAILGEDYAKRINADGIQDLLILRKEIQKEKIWQKLGGSYSVEEKEILLSLLCRVEKESHGSDILSQEGWENKSGGLREMWQPIECRKSPQGREYQKQLAEKFKEVATANDNHTKRIRND